MIIFFMAITIALSAAGPSHTKKELPIISVEEWRGPYRTVQLCEDAREHAKNAVEAQINVWLKSRPGVVVAWAFEARCEIASDT